MEKIVYSPSVLELITVATEYCRTLEQCRTENRSRFLQVMRGLLPMVYLKMTWLPAMPEDETGWNEHRVTEEDYEYVRQGVASLLGESDTFLDVFVEDFRYSENPVLCTISENLADVYQQLRELVETFRQGYEESMEVALAECTAEFKLQWGQKLLNALRAIHDVAMNVAEH